MYDVGRPNPATGGRADAASIEYDASVDSYIVRAGDDRFEFGPEHLTNAIWNYLAFQKADGNVTTKLDFDWREVSEWTTATDYVRLAQLHTAEKNIPAGTETYQIVDLVFGSPSDAASLPRAGSATFLLSLRGSRTTAATGTPMSMSGSATALVDFGTGILDFRGTTTDLTLDRHGAYNWNSEVKGTAALTADANGFAGTFEAKAGTLETYTGDFVGLFYGPEAQEIGGIFYGTSGPLYYSLAFAGYQQPKIGPEDTLAALTGVSRLDTVSRIIPLPDNDPYFTEYPFREHVIYDADKKTYQVFAAAAGEFGTANRTPAKDQTDIVSYGAAVAAVDGKLSYDIGRFDGETDGIELTYTSFFRVVKTLTDLDDKVLSKEVAYLGFGNATPADQLPRTGTASYVGRLFGDVNDGTDLLSPLRGTVALKANFGTQALTASLSPQATNFLGSAVNFGTFDFVGSIDSYRGYFDASRVTGEGSLSGRFFGDRAQEFAATFGIGLPDRGLMLEGVAVGRQDGSP